MRHRLRAAWREFKRSDAEASALFEATRPEWCAMLSYQPAETIASPSSVGPVLVYGHSTQAAEICDLLRRIGRRPIYLLQAGHSDAPPAGVATRPIAEVDWSFCRSVVVLDAPERGPEGGFVEACRRLVDDFGAAGALVHPAALPLGYRMRTPELPRWAVVGYHGSGNILVQAILARLLPDTVVGDPILRHLGDTQALGLRRLVEATFGDLPDFNYHIGPSSQPCWCALAGSTKLGWFTLSGLPYAGFLDRNIGTHAVWTRPAQAFVENLGFTGVWALRHPLNALRSYFRKLPGEGAELRASASLFAANVEPLMRFFSEASRPDSGLYRVRFEELLADPVSVIVALADAISAPVDAATARTIADDTLYRELVGQGSGHFRDPRTAPAAFFNRLELAILQREGVRDIAEAEGYAWPIPLETPQRSTPRPSGSTSVSIFSSLNLPGHVWSPPGAPWLQLRAETAELVNDLRERVIHHDLPRFCHSLGTAAMPSGF